MRCRKADTDQSFFLTLNINGVPCTEYSLPPSASNTTLASNVLQCFVPVSADDKITVHGTFTGTVLHASFDLLGDGSFVGDKRIEGEKSGELKFYYKRPLDWKYVLNIPKPEDWSSIYEPKMGVLGDLVIKALPSLEEEEDGARVQGVIAQMNKEGTKLGVGSIAIVVSVTQKDNEGYVHDYADKNHGAWKWRDPQGVSHAGALPTHELVVQMTEQIHTNRQSKHRRHYEELRFGKQPWVMFVFHYRSQMAVQQAGCVILADKEHELSGDGVEGYIMSTPAQREKTHKGRSTGLGKKWSGEPVDTHQMVEMSPSPVAPPVPPPVLQPVSQPIPQSGPQPAPRPTKKRLLGQSLFSSRPSLSVRSESPETLFVGQASPDDDEMSFTSDISRGSPSIMPGGSHRMESSGARNLEQSIADEPERNSDTGVSANISPGKKASLSGHSQGTAGELNAGDRLLKESLLDAAHPAAGSAAPAQHHTLNTASENIMRAPSQASSRRSHSITQTPDRIARNEISHDDLHALASVDGVVPLHTLASYCDEHHVDQDIGMLRMQEIAFKSGTSYVISDGRRKSMSKGAAPAQAAVDKAGAGVASVGPSTPVAGVDIGRESTGPADSIEAKVEDVSQSNPLVPTAANQDQIATASAAPVFAALTAEIGTTTTKVGCDPARASPAAQTIPFDISITTSATVPSLQGSSPATPSSLKRKAPMDQSPFSREGTPAKKQKTDFDSMEEYKAYLKAETERKKVLIKQTKEEKARKAAEEKKREEERKAREEAAKKRREEEKRAREEAEKKKAREEAIQKEIEELERLNDEEDKELEALIID